MGVFKFEPAGRSWDAHERNWFLTRKTEAERKTDGPGYGLTGLSVTLALALVVGSVAAVLKHESSVAAKQHAFNERVASRLSHPQDEEDVLPKLRQVAETTWNSVPTNGYQSSDILIKMHRAKDGGVDVTVNDIPVAHE